MIFFILAADKPEYLELPIQTDSSRHFSIDPALAHVAQLTVEKLQHVYLS